MAAQQPQGQQPQNREIRLYDDPQNVPHHQGDEWYTTSVGHPYRNRDRTKKEQYYDKIAYHRGMPMPIDKQGPNGTAITTRLSYGPGAEELTRIVAGLQRGIRQINGTQTLQGANDWIIKNKKTGWQADEIDITGPEGRPDGVKEIVIVDANGGVRVVNGYSLGPSSYAWRRAYYETHPDAATRAQESFGEYKYANTRYNNKLDANGNFAYGQDMAGYNVIRNKIKPRNLYRQIFFTPTWKQFKTELPAELNTMARSQLSSQVFNYVWEMLFLNPAIVDKDGTVNKATIVAMRAKDYNAAKKSDGVKDYIADQLKQILNDNSNEKQNKLFQQTAHLIAVALNDYFGIPLSQGFTCYGMTKDILLNYTTMATYMDDANQAGNVDRGITAAQTAIKTAYDLDVADRQTKAQTRDTKNQTSHNKWVTLPMNWPDVRKASREIGWKKYTGQNVDQNLLNQLQTLINNHSNGGNAGQGGQPQQGQGQPQQANQQQPQRRRLPAWNQHAWATLARTNPEASEDELVEAYRGLNSQQIMRLAGQTPNLSPNQYQMPSAFSQRRPIQINLGESEPEV